MSGNVTNVGNAILYGCLSSLMYYELKALRFLALIKSPDKSELLQQILVVS